jgi:hypothetical protein
VVAVGLVLVGVLRAVIAGVAEGVGVAVQLVLIDDKPAVVGGV